MVLKYINIVAVRGKIVGRETVRKRKLSPSKTNQKHKISDENVGKMMRQLMYPTGFEGDNFGFRTVYQPTTFARTATICIHIIYVLQLFN